MHLEHLNTFMERARNYNEVQPQTTHSKSSLHLAYSERACFLFSEEAMWHDRLIFHDILQKNCKAEVLFNLTYASGVIWRPVNYNHAWLVLKLSSMPLNEKKKNLHFFTVKKQNIVRECLLWVFDHKRPVHVQDRCFSFAHSNSAQVYSRLCVHLKHV